MPNLVESRRVPSPKGTIRVFQEGAQNVIGLDFRASLTMDMQELVRDKLMRPLPARRLKFSCYQSEMFATFEGEWKVEAMGSSTLLSYMVDITPKGAVPVPALEWRIREDVPPNLSAIAAATEAGKRRVTQAGKG